MEVVDSVLKGSRNYNIRDNIMSALAAFYDNVFGSDSNYQNNVSVNSKPDHPPSDPRRFAHSICPFGRAFAPLFCPGAAWEGVLNQSKSSIILKQKRDFRFVS